MVFPFKGTDPTPWLALVLAFLIACAVRAGFRQETKSRATEWRGYTQKWGPTRP